MFRSSANISAARSFTNRHPNQLFRKRARAIEDQRPQVQRVAIARAMISYAFYQLKRALIAAKVAVSNLLRK
jgi:hypothetical protein